MSATFAIVVHGGAGAHRDGALADRVRGCEAAAERGLARLREGGCALDAVQAAVTAMEDDPLFNAGRGAPLNAAGRVELDASIMDGRGLRAGAVGAVAGVANPIALARAVLEDGRHVLLVADGARAFAEERGIALCAEDDLIIEAERQRWQERFGTVGAAAVDGHGNLAAATSTGGLFGKLPGRVGDSALIGAGTYADAAAAVSCTGVGEAIIRMVLAKRVCDELGAGSAPQAAAQRAIEVFAARTAGEGGLIAMARDGTAAWASNAAHMPICWLDARGRRIARSV